MKKSAPPLSHGVKLEWATPAKVTFSNRTPQNSKLNPNIFSLKDGFRADDRGRHWTMVRLLRDSLHASREFTGDPFYPERFGGCRRR
jgi:hypothetical protein